MRRAGLIAVVHPHSNDVGAMPPDAAPPVERDDTAAIAKH